MPKGIFKVPVPINEPIKNYAPGSPERKELQAMLAEMRSKEINIPMYIGSEEVESNVPVSYTHLDVYKRQALFQGQLAHLVPEAVVTCIGFQFIVINIAGMRANGI